MSAAASMSVHFRRGDDAGWWIGDRRATVEEVAAARPRCPSAGRHWFTLYGFVGQPRPDCARCGAPNPRPLSLGELREFEALGGARRSRYFA